MPSPRAINAVSGKLSFPAVRQPLLVDDAVDPVAVPVDMVVEVEVVPKLVELEVLCSMVGGARESPSLDQVAP
jgi:hypothetical protein